MKKKLVNKTKNYQYKKKSLLDKTIEKRYNILIIIIFIVIFILGVSLFYIQIIKNNYYVDKVHSLSKTIVTGESTPRGRIYDRNHRLIVNNKPVKIITYKKNNKVNGKKEIELAYKLAELIDVDYSKLTIEWLKKFWIKNNGELAKEKITKKEWKKLEERKITSDDIESLKLERVTDEELSSFDELDKEAAYIYKLMTTGYYYTEKIIKNSDITDEEYAIVASSLDELIGFDIKLDWEREYLYGDTFKSILGNVSTMEVGIPAELKDYYLNLGYKLNDRVGTSYLEYQYEDILKGQKETYELLKDGNKKVITEGKRGNDIVLTIDIELQQEVEKILESELIKTKSEPNTDYYNRSFVIIADPNTGEILAMSGKQIVMVDGSYKIYDYTPGIITSPVVVGSVVKGASHIVGYNTGALEIGEVRDDACIKIAATPIKCSWSYLGKLNDITALALSSNTYQFRTAIKAGKGNYVYDEPLKIDESVFDTYRNTFAEFGLGVKTEIDLPIESLGYKGKSRKPGLLLDFSIGQYDTYTPIQLSQYIGTIANGGNRMKPYLLKEVYSPNNKLDTKIDEITPKVLNTVNTKKEYLDRIKLGFRQVMIDGIGANHIASNLNAAGKTGTSQSFIDSDLDGTVDTETLTTTFVAYAPYDNPIVTFTVISPDSFYSETDSGYQSPVNRRIAYEISKKFFEIYQ